MVLMLMEYCLKPGLPPAETRTTIDRIRGLVALLELRPNIYGVGIDLNAVINRVLDRFDRRRI